MSARECTRIIGWHAYYDPRLCLCAEPGRGFLKLTDYVWGCGYERFNGYEIGRLLLRVGDAMECITRAVCYFGRPSGVSYFTNHNGYYYGYCVPREGVLRKYPNHYVSIDLQVTASNECQDPAVLVENRICACPDGTYSDGYDTAYSPRRIICLPLPSSFNRSALKLDAAYTYDGREHVQHHRLVTYEQCVYGRISWSSKYIRGYMSQDEQYCVPECPPYQEAADGQCHCVANFAQSPDHSSCTCGGYLSLDRKNCLTECGMHQTPVDK